MRIGIHICDETVGYLTDEGELISENPTIKRLARRVKRVQTTELIRGKKGTVGLRLITVERAHPAYVGAVIERLLDAGYDLTAED